MHSIARGGTATFPLRKFTHPTEAFRPTRAVQRGAIKLVLMARSEFRQSSELGIFEASSAARHARTMMRASSRLPAYQETLLAEREGISEEDPTPGQKVEAIARPTTAKPKK